MNPADKSQDASRNNQATTFTAPQHYSSSLAVSGDLASSTQAYLVDDIPNPYSFLALLGAPMIPSVNASDNMLTASHIPIPDSTERVLDKFLKEASAEAGSQVDKQSGDLIRASDVDLFFEGLGNPSTATCSFGDTRGSTACLVNDPPYQFQNSFASDLGQGLGACVDNYSHYVRSATMVNQYCYTAPTFNQGHNTPAGLLPGSHNMAQPENRPLATGGREKKVGRVCKAGVSLTQVTENINPYVVVTWDPEKDLPSGRYCSPILRYSPDQLVRAIKDAEKSLNEARPRLSQAEAQLRDGKTGQDLEGLSVKRDREANWVANQERRLELLTAMQRLHRKIKVQEWLIESINREIRHFRVSVHPGSSLDTTYDLGGILGDEERADTLSDREVEIVASQYIAFKTARVERKNQLLSLVSVTMQFFYKDLSQKIPLAERNETVISLAKNVFQTLALGDGKQIREACNRLRAEIKNLPDLDGYNYFRERYYNYLGFLLSLDGCLQERNRILSLARCVPSSTATTLATPPQHYSSSLAANGDLASSTQSDLVDDTPNAYGSFNQGHNTPAGLLAESHNIAQPENKRKKIERRVGKEDVPLTQVTENINPYVVVTWDPEKDLPSGRYCSPILRCPPDELVRAIKNAEESLGEAKSRLSQAEAQLRDAKTGQELKGLSVERDREANWVANQKRQLELLIAMQRLRQQIEVQKGLIKSLSLEASYFDASLYPGSSLDTTYNLVGEILGDEERTDRLSDREREIVESQYIAFKTAQVEWKNQRLSLVSVNLESAYKKSCPEGQTEIIASLLQNLFQASASGDEKQFSEACDSLRTGIRDLPELNSQALENGAFHDHRELLSLNQCLEERDRILAGSVLSSTTNNSGFAGEGGSSFNNASADNYAHNMPPSSLSVSHDAYAAGEAGLAHQEKTVAQWVAPAVDNYSHYVRSATMVNQYCYTAPTFNQGHNTPAGLLPGSHNMAQPENRPFATGGREKIPGRVCKAGVSLTQVTENINPCVAVTWDPEKDLSSGRYCSPILRYSPDQLVQAVADVKRNRDAAEAQLHEAEARLSYASAVSQSPEVDEELKRAARQGVEKYQREKDSAGAAIAYQKGRLGLLMSQFCLLQHIEVQKTLIEFVKQEKVYFFGVSVDPGPSLDATYNLVGEVLGDEERTDRQPDSDVEVVASQYIKFKAVELKEKTKRLVLLTITLGLCFKELSRKAGLSEEQEAMVASHVRDVFQTLASGDEEELRQACDRLLAEIRNLPELDAQESRDFESSPYQIRYQEYDRFIRSISRRLQEPDRILDGCVLSSTATTLATPPQHYSSSLAANGYLASSTQTQVKENRNPCVAVEFEPEKEPSVPRKRVYAPTWFSPPVLPKVSRVEAIREDQTLFVAPQQLCQ